MLKGHQFVSVQSVVLPDCEEPLSVPVTSAACIAGGQQAIGISHADSGMNLDITRNLEIWVCVELQKQVLSTDQSSENNNASFSFRIYTFMLTVSITLIYQLL